MLAQYIREHSKVPTGKQTDRSVEADVETAAEVLARVTSAAPEPHGLSLARTNLYEIDMRNANLSGWTLDYVEARFTKFDGAQMIGTDMFQGSLQSTSFVGANLTEAVFVHTDFDSTNLDGCRAVQANFSHSEMSSVSFKGAILQAAVFKNVTMNGVDFAEADLTLTVFTGADLSGADFSQAKALSLSQVADARKWDQYTRWPEEFGSIPIKG